MSELILAILFTISLWLLHDYHNRSRDELLDFMLEVHEELQEEIEELHFQDLVSRFQYLNLTHKCYQWIDCKENEGDIVPVKLVDWSDEMDELSLIEMRRTLEIECEKRGILLGRFQVYEE